MKHRKNEHRVPRLMQKNGQCNIRKTAAEKRRRYLDDIFTTMVDLKWRYAILIFIGIYFISWLVFSFLYFLIVWNRKQLWYQRGGYYDKVKIGAEDGSHCIHSYEDERCFYNVDTGRET